jgi:hypothetical protein
MHTSFLSRSANLIAAGATALLLSNAAFAQDDCTTATPVVNGANGPFSNVGATTSFPWVAPCAFNSNGGADIWFSYTAPATGSLTVDTCGGAFDTVLEIFDGTAGCGGLVAVGCNDDSCGLQSSATIGTTGGTTYFIRVGGYANQTGNFPLNLTFVVPGDECATALAAVDGANGPFSNGGYSSSAEAWGCGFNVGNDMWFAYSPSCNGTAMVDTCGSGFDTVLMAFDGVCGTLNPLACNDDTCGLQSSISFPVAFGTTYYIRVGGYNLQSGSFGLNISCAPSTVVNDDCALAIPVIDGSNGPFTNINSTTSFPWPCALGGNDVWYSYVASCCGNLTAALCNAVTTYDSAIEIFTGDCSNLVSLGCNDDSCGLQSSLTVPVATGLTYYIRVGGFNGSMGNFQLDLTCTAGAPVNDDCAGAIPVGLGMNGPFNNLCATTTSPWPCALGGNDMWYVFTANCTCPTTFRTCGADYDTAIEVFDGTGGCGALVSIGCNDDAGANGPCAFTLQSSLTVNLTTGTTYYVRVGGFGGSQGNFPLEILTGTGNGSIAMTTASACQTPSLNLSVTGNPHIGGTITMTMSGFSGAPFVTWGFAPAPLLAPGCPCLILSVATNWMFGTTNSLTMPCDPSFIGMPLGAQGADLFGASSACPVPVPNAFTDVYTATIG